MVTTAWLLLQPCSSAGLLDGPAAGGPAVRAGSPPLWMCIPELLYRWTHCRPPRALLAMPQMLTHLSHPRHTTVPNPWVCVWCLQSSLGTPQEHQGASLARLPWQTAKGADGLLLALLARAVPLHKVLQLLRDLVKPRAVVGVAVKAAG